MHTAAFHHSFTTANMQTTVRFYRDMLGLKPWETIADKGKAPEAGTGVPGIHIVITLMVFDSPDSWGGGEWVEFFQFLNPDGKQQLELRPFDVGYSYLSFDVDNVQDAYEKLLSKGVGFVSRPVNLTVEGPKVTIVRLLDADGRVVELRSDGR